MASVRAQPQSTAYALHQGFLPDSRITTSLAAPPPPLYLSAQHGLGPERQMRYAGADHTLGPMFSEEEDGDDTAFIAAKMASMGLDPKVTAAAQYHSAQSDPHALAQAQRYQQEALFDLLEQQTAPYHAHAARQLFAQQQAQRAFAAAQQYATYDQARLLRNQQEMQHERQVYIQQQHLQQMQYMQELHLQQQLSALQPSRAALSANMQSQLQNRTVAQSRGMTLDDSQIRARFEAATDPLTPDGSPHVIPFTNPRISPTSWRTSESPSPVKTSIVTPPEPLSAHAPTSPIRPSHTSTVHSPKGGRFAQARKEMEADGEITFGTLTSTLSGRSLASVAGNPAEEGPKAEKQVEESVAKYTRGALGKGRPGASSAQVRSASLPLRDDTAKMPAPAPRSVSLPQPSIGRITVTRQPLGPPGEAKELGDRNFQSRIRGQAGLKLGMLGRRTDSPSLALGNA